MPSDDPKAALVCIDCGILAASPGSRRCPGCATAYYDPKAAARSIAAQLLGRKGGMARTQAQREATAAMGRRNRGKGPPRQPLPCRDCGAITLCRDKWARPACEAHGGTPKAPVP